MERDQLVFTAILLLSVIRVSPCLGGAPFMNNVRLAEKKYVPARGATNAEVDVSKRLLPLSVTTVNPVNWAFGYVMLLFNDTKQLALLALLPPPPLLVEVDN